MVEYAYDIMDRVTNISWKTTSGATIGGFGYEYDAVGRIVSRSHSIGSNAFDRVYAYDDLDRLASDGDVTYTYDAAGNRTTRTENGLTTTYTLGVGDRLATWTGGSCAYDFAGNVTRIEHDGRPTLDLTWNSQYQLVSVATNGVFAESYAYDALGRRVSTTTLEGTTRHVYDEGWQVIADLDEQDNCIASYVWGDGIDRLLAVKIGGALYYPLTDIQGTIWGYVDSQNNVVARWQYNAWGNVVDEFVTVPVLANIRYRFQCREWSAATGLINFRMRWYDPETGRWLSKDPIGLSGGLNLYSFCFNMTLDRIDPSGCDDYVPDNAKHGGSHVDRYHGGKNVGRYNEDGTGIKSKGKLPPKIPRSEWPKFQAAASKLRCGMGLVSWIPGIFEDIKMHKKAKENGRSFSEQVEEEYKEYEFLITPIGIIPNPYYRPPNMDAEGRLTI